MSDKEYKNYLIRCRRRRPDVKEKEKAYLEKYRAEHPDWLERKRKADKTFYKNHRSDKIAKTNLYNSRPCRDPVAGDVCRYNTLMQRKRLHPEWYKDISPAACLVDIPKIKGLDDNLKAEYNL